MYTLLSAAHEASVDNDTVFYKKANHNSILYSTRNEGYHCGGHSSFFTIGYVPLARVTLYPTDKHTSDDLFGAAHLLFVLHAFTFQLLDKPWSTGVIPSLPRFLPSIFIAHRVQQPHCSSIFHRVLLTYALALSASQFVHKKSP